MNKSKQYNVIYVLWSGGMDSTYLIQHLLDSNSNNVVWASYVEVDNNYTKIKAEKNAIKKLVPLLKKKYGDRFEYLGVSYKINIINHHSNLYLEQMSLWITSIIFTTPVYQVKYIALGYVMNDDAISYLDDFRRIIKSYNALSQLKYPKLIFPLYKTHKVTIWENIDPLLRKYIVWCENPKKKGKLCKKCHACQRHRNDIKYEK